MRWLLLHLSVFEFLLYFMTCNQLLLGILDFFFFSSVHDPNAFDYVFQSVLLNALYQLYNVSWMSCHSTVPSFTEWVRFRHTACIGNWYLTVVYLCLRFMFHCLQWTGIHTCYGWWAVSLSLQTVISFLVFMTVPNNKGRHWQKAAMHSDQESKPC